MRSKALKKTVSMFLTGIMFTAAVPAASMINSDALQIPDKKGEYDYELWSERDSDSVSMTNGENGTFSCSWNNAHNCLFRAGKKFSGNTKWDSLNGIEVTYDVDYQPNGNSYLCVYGWTKDPLVEYYIVDNYGTWRPPTGGAPSSQEQQRKGTITVDGATYEVYAGTHHGPSIIQGVEDFNQYWSVREGGSKRSKGSINVAAHFKAWEGFGMKMGSLYEVALNVEGYESSGKATVNKNVLTIGDGVKVEPDNPVEPDDNGAFITNDFDKSTGDWQGRGSAKVSSDSKNYYAGGSSMFVSGRKDKWNGAEISLPSGAFIAGGTYSFSAAVLQKSGTATDMKMTLQYSTGTTTEYKEIALVGAKSGQWTKLENSSYTIPSGASNLILYIEAPDDLTDFYVDNFTAAVKGNKSDIKTGNGTVEGGGDITVDPTDPPANRARGDYNGDNSVDVFDLVLARRAIVNYMAGSAQPNLYAADVDGSGSFEINDVVLLSKYLMGQIKTFPKAQVTTTTSSKPEQQTTTTSKQQYSGDYMAQIANDMKTNAPSGFNQKRGGVDYGKLDTVTYFSKDGNCQKKMCVILPAGYDKSKKYPVLYCLHGIGGNETSMPGMGVQTMLGNMLADGACEPMIIVCPNMMTGQGNGMGFDAESMRKYDLVREDIENSIMPYMEQNYSVKTGRENTAITGFSLGGREALYTGITRSQYYGYVGSACAAPGIFKTRDYIMEHEGSLKSESELTPSTMPYLILVSAAANDSVVGTYPQDYHNVLTKNNVEHLWNMIPQGDHGNATVEPHLYNFMRYIFKAS